MKLARYAAAGNIYLGEVSNGSVRDLLADRHGAADLVVRHLAGESDGAGATRPAGEVSFLAPVVRPGKIIAIGLNYLDHCRETGAEPPSTPVLFAKYSNSIIGPGESIRFRRQDTAEVDFEVELAAVIGRRCSRVSEDQALDHVFAYTLANDVSARDIQRETSQWTRGKTFDTFLPLGPVLVTADEVGDPQTIDLRCIVNGTAYQNSNTAEMIFPVRKLVSHLSQTITLEPGDVILTGTPWGVGMARSPQVFLADGDRVRVESDRLGSMENPVQAS